ncbi:hypothetical protein B566_EDAN008886 [Ephemera danica]|nr:hypothetical protein B566_EDAN008886 [Ephemera danica]
MAASEEEHTISSTLPSEESILWITFFAGTAANELLNLILKHILCEARPMARNSLYTEYGMPSSHAQFMWFFATYCVYFVIIRLHHMNNNTTLESIWKSCLVGVCIKMAVIVNISRDTSLIPNILWFEYTNSRQEARARGRKLVTMKSQ